MGNVKNKYDILFLRLFCAFQDLNKRVGGHKTGCIQWPGTEVQLDYYHCDSVWKYGDYDIVTDVSSITNTTDRVKRSVEKQDNRKKESFNIIRDQKKNVSREMENNGIDEAKDSEFFFNKTIDKVRKE